MAAGCRASAPVLRWPPVAAAHGSGPWRREWLSPGTPAAAGLGGGTRRERGEGSPGQWV